MSEANLGPRGKGMKQAVFIVSACKDCPWVDYDPDLHEGEEYACEHVDGPTYVDPNTVHPKCPLDDAVLVAQEEQK